MPTKSKQLLATTSGYINRELSWVEFNARVLSEALNPANPLLERLKFIAIVSSNFDEFFMVRVAGLKREATEGNAVACPSGRRPSEVLEALMARIQQIVATQNDCLMQEIFPALTRHGVLFSRPDECNEAHREYLARKFEQEVFPTLSPVVLEAEKRLPFTGNLRLHMAFRLRPVDQAEGATTFAIVQIPHSLDRIWEMPRSYDGALRYVLLEDIILAHASELFPGHDVIGSGSFRLTRDADVSVDEDDDIDFLGAMSNIIMEREHSKPVRLQMSNIDTELADLLVGALHAEDAERFTVTGPLELKSFMTLAARVPLDHLREPEWPPMTPRDLPPESNLWQVLRERDILLHHPYESFDPVVQLVAAAAADDRVLAIKMTLYRTSGRSPIIKALARAAETGKQVTAIVELKARFDEERNIQWSRQLERAGVIVIYGIARLKVHSKATLVVRREDDGVHRYAHLATGNYNDSTAKLYTDFGLMTSRDEITYEVARFFNAITGLSASSDLQRLVMAPVGMRGKFRHLIEREIKLHSREAPGMITAKMNALVDPEIIELLYLASNAGVKVRLNVRGICCLRPGVKGLSEHIEVVSIVDRFLEHSRVYCFHNGGQIEVYLASADWMPRNLDNRVELMFPIEQPDLRARLLGFLDAYFKDNTNSHVMQSDGAYRRLKPGPGETPFRVQETFYREARALAKELEAPPTSEFPVRRRPPGSAR